MDTKIIVRLEEDSPKFTVKIDQDSTATQFIEAMVGIMKVLTYSDKVIDSALADYVDATVDLEEEPASMFDPEMFGPNMFRKGVERAKEVGQSRLVTYPGRTFHESPEVTCYTGKEHGSSEVSTVTLGSDTYGYESQHCYDPSKIGANNYVWDSSAAIEADRIRNLETNKV